MALSFGDASQQNDNRNTPATSGQQTHDYDALCGFTRFYLDTYYKCAPTIDEIAINKFLLKELTRMERRFDVYVEGSCEAVVTKTIPIGGAAAPGGKTGWADSIVLSDFRGEARAETYNWAKAAPNSFSWDHYVQMSLVHEGIDPSLDAIAARTEAIRDKITNILSCNVLDRPVVSTPLTPDSLFGLFFVAGEVGETIDGWKQVIENVAASLPVGAHLFSTALRGMSEYEVKRPSGGHDTYPCARLFGDHYRQLLPELGFSMPVVEEFEIATPDVGLAGIIMISATKTA